MVDETQENAIQRLTAVGIGATRTSKVIISYSRKLNTGNYQSEDFFMSKEVDFDSFWKMMDSYPVAEREVVIPKVFKGVFKNAIGLALNDCYATTTVATYIRAKALNLNTAETLKEELDAFKAKNGFDPFGVNK